MFKPAKPVLHFGAGALAVGALLLAAPKAEAGQTPSIATLTGYLVNLAQSPRALRAF